MNQDECNICKSEFKTEIEKHGPIHTPVCQSCFFSSKYMETPPPLPADRETVRTLFIEEAK